MRLILIGSLVTFFATWIPQVAHGSIITFESVSNADISADTLNIEVDGVTVTFSSVGLQITNFGTAFGNAGNVLSSLGNAQPITVTFSTPVFFVEVENVINGRFTSEVDLIEAEGFDQFDVLVDSVGLTSDSIIRLDGAPSLSRAVYDDVGTGYVLDNFNFQVVPEPSGIAMIGLGITTILAIRSRNLGRAR